MSIPYLAHFVATPLERTTPNAEPLVGANGLNCFET